MDPAEDPGRLHDEFVETALAIQAHFGDREPTQDEVYGYLRDRLVTEGRTPEEADEILRGGA